MKKASSGSNLDASLEMLSLIYSFKPCICQEKSSGVYRQNSKITRTSRLTRSASILVHVEVWNGYVRAGRWSRPTKTALERSYSTENSSSANRTLRPRFFRLAAFLIFLDRILQTTCTFPCFISSSPADAKQNNRSLASYLGNRSRKKPWPIGSKPTN